MAFFQYYNPLPEGQENTLGNPGDRGTQIQDWLGEKGDRV
jgi:hypothetical protein